MKTRTFLGLAALGVTGPMVYGTPIGVAARVGSFVVKHQTSVAVTYAAAHTAGGTGAPGSGLTGPNVSITGAAVSAISSDFFAHPPPPSVTGNDVAFASAFGTSWALGFRGIATANATATKGDFALAAAYARGGAYASQISGDCDFTVSFGIGGLTITASKDPEQAFYGFVVSDQDPLELNDVLLSQSLAGFSVKPVIEPALPSGLSLGTPANVLFGLYVGLDGPSKTLSVWNFGSLVTTPITVADFEDVSVGDNYSFTLKGTGEYSFDLLNGPNVSERAFTFDEMAMKVAVASDGGSPLLMVGLAFVLLNLLRYGRSWGLHRR